MPLAASPSFSPTGDSAARSRSFYAQLPGGGGAGAGGVLHITGATINAGTYAADLGEGGGRSPNETPGTSAVKTTVVPDILAVTGLSLVPVAVLI